MPAGLSLPRRAAPGVPVTGVESLYIASDGKLHRLSASGVDTNLESGGGGGVSSFEGRTGAVVATDADYLASEVVVTPAGAMSSTRVQAALEEIQTDATTGITNAATAQTTANAAVPKSVGTTAGDILGFSASATPVRLPGPTASGQVPVATGAGTWSWALLLLVGGLVLDSDLVGTAEGLVLDTAADLVLT